MRPSSQIIISSGLFLFCGAFNFFPDSYHSAGATLARQTFSMLHVDGQLAANFYVSMISERLQHFYSNCTAAVGSCCLCVNKGSCCLPLTNTYSPCTIAGVSRGDECKSNVWVRGYVLVSYGPIEPLEACIQGSKQAEFINLRYYTSIVSSGSLCFANSGSFCKIFRVVLSNMTPFYRYSYKPRCLLPRPYSSTRGKLYLVLVQSFWCVFWCTEVP